MKYVVGRIGSMLGDEFRVRYTNPKLIEANSENEAIDFYNNNLLRYPEGSLKFPLKAALDFSRCIGYMDDDGKLLIPNFHMRYESGKKLEPALPGMRYHLVSRLLDEPKELSDFGRYIPMFIQAACPEDALSIYEEKFSSSRFKAYVLGYLDENNTFIVPNILDFVS